MSDLEERASELLRRNQELEYENSQLRINQDAVKNENMILKKYVKEIASFSGSNLQQPDSPQREDDKQEDWHTLTCKTEPEYHGSAASAVSLPKDQTRAQTCWMMQQAVCTLVLRSVHFTLLLYCFVRTLRLYQLSLFCYAHVCCHRLVRLVSEYVAVCGWRLVWAFPLEPF